MLRSITLVFLLGAFSLPNWANTSSECAQLIKDSYLSGLIKQTQRLNPRLLKEKPTSLVGIYQVLKTEYEKFDNESIPSELADHLKSQYGGNFELATLKPQEMTQIYRNFLAGLIARTAKEWRSREVTKIFGELEKDERELMMSVLDGFAKPQNDFYTSFGSRFYKLEVIQKSFDEKPWLNFPWTLALDTVRRFHTETEGNWKEFEKWLEQSDAEIAAAFGKENVRRLVSAENRLRLRQEPEQCCNTRCFDCPNNYGWRKK